MRAWNSSADRRAYRGGSTPSEVVLGGRRIVLPRLRARSVPGAELPLPSFAYANAHDPSTRGPSKRSPAG